MRSGAIPDTYKGSRGFRDATTDEAEIRRRWAERPDAEIGAGTGTLSDLIVLDVDGDHGADSLAALEREYGPLPATASVKTSSGGTHYHFTAAGPVPCSVGKIGDGLDVRADGGYAVLPPSRGYAWDSEDARTVPPGWLLRLMLDAKSRRNGRPPTVKKTIPEGRATPATGGIGASELVTYPEPSSALIWQRSIEARVPGVSPGSISSRGPSAAAMSSAVSKSWITTAVRWSSSWRIWMPLAGMSTGGPSASIPFKRPAR